MKKEQTNKMRNMAFCATVALAGLFTACQNDNPKPEEDGGKVSLKLFDAKSQAGRFVPSITTRALSNKEHLLPIGTFTVPSAQQENKWSATSIAFEGNTAYVTWHSNLTAKDAATVYGGAVDVVDITTPSKPEVKTMGICGSLKFNHVYPYNGNLFLSATHEGKGGAVGRIAVNGGNLAAEVECIGFPGKSVNAVVEKGGTLYGVSGHSAGAFASFDPTAAAGNYYYGVEVTKIAEQNQKIAFISTAAPTTQKGLETALAGFGGKYVTTDEDGNVYALYSDKDGNAFVMKGDGTKIALNIKLVSDQEKQEDGTKAFSDYFGKHCLVVRGGYMYVAAGASGLKVFNVSGEDQTATKLNDEQNLYTAGVFVEKIDAATRTFVYASTGLGLRVYELQADGKLVLYAFEVNSYNADGSPATNAPVVFGGENGRNSANFVAVHNGYIYVAYGQSGVYVYKLVLDATPSMEEMVPEDGGEISLR